MTTEQEPGRTGGSVPLHYGNALAWRWSREMPTPLRRGFLTLLYALRAMANANGELRFHSDHKPIRIQDIAKAAGADEKDARRYLRAAIAAGVVGTKGEPRRGKATLYTLLVSPFPDWGAAEEVLKSTRRKSGKTPPPWKPEEASSGDRAPNQFGGPRPELHGEDDEKVRGTAPRTSSGDRAPIGSGDRAPNNPGIAKELPQEMAGLGEQPQVVAAPVANKIDSPTTNKHQDPPRAAERPRRRPRRPRCAGCNSHLLPIPGQPPRTHCHNCEAQERTA